MAYERYIDKTNRTYIVLSRWHNATMINGEMHFYPTTIDLLKVEAEEMVNVSYKDFEQKVSEGILKRILKPLKS